MDFQEEYNLISGKLDDAKNEVTEAQDDYAFRKNKFIEKRLDALLQQAIEGKISEEEYAIEKSDLMNSMQNASNSYREAKLNYYRDETEQGRSALNFIINGILSEYPEYEQLNEFIEQEWVASQNVEFFSNELKGLKPTSEKLEPSPSQEIANIQNSVKVDLKQYITPMKDIPHLYPVDTVVGWTNKLKDINRQLDNYIEALNEVSLQDVDKTWLRKQIEKFVDWINSKLAALRKQIVKGLKGVFTQAKKALDVVTGVVPTSLSLTSVITWGMNVIGLFMKPFQVLTQFIIDFMKYTPPLVAEAGKVVGKVATTPSLITSKMEELKGEGNEIIKQEIENAVGGIKFEPITLGDLQ